jgi:hypothetical protein
MAKSKAKPNKYANKSPQVFENGFVVTLGGADEIAHHYRLHFHHFLEYLALDPSAQNPLEQVGDGEPALRDSMRRAGLAGLTRDELLEKRDKYVARLEAGDAPYSSKLSGSYWIESPNKEQLIVSFKN